jgi:hypothetical protein
MVALGGFGMKYIVYIYCILLSGCLSDIKKIEYITDAAEIDNEETLKSYAKYANNNYYTLRDNLKLSKYPGKAHYGLSIRMRGVDYDVNGNIITIEYETRTGVIKYILFTNKKDIIQ